jgi:L-threonylcarbamoyladenylate synthase
MDAPLVLPAADDRALTRAGEILRDGGLVVLPTDTVYGLAAALDRPGALRRVYEAKGRPEAKELPVLLASASAIEAVAPRPEPAITRFAEQFWPGPLTIVVPARAGLPAEVLGPGGTVGVRVPDHPIALRLIDLAGGALAVTSANRSGAQAATTAADAIAQLGAAVDLILDGGMTSGGRASTVAGFEGGRLRIFRDGPISADVLERAWTTALAATHESSADLVPEGT